MKIDSDLTGWPASPTPGIPNTATPVPKGVSVGGCRPNPDLQLDTKGVSSAAQLAHIAMSIPDVQASRVANLQNALDNNAYQVDASAVAESILHKWPGILSTASTD